MYETNSNIWFCCCCFDVGERRVWNGSARWMQAEVFGIKSKEKSSIHCVQNWWVDTTGYGRKAWWTGPKLRGFHRMFPIRRMSLRCLWFRFHHWRELPEEQNLLHCLVIFISFSIFFSFCVCIVSVYTIHLGMFKACVFEGIRDFHMEQFFLRWFYT